MVSRGALLVSTGTIETLTREGVDLIFQRSLRPAEAAMLLVHSPAQLNADETLFCVRRAFAVLIEEALIVQRRVPRFDLTAERVSSASAVRSEDIARIAGAAQQAARKLDAVYAAKNGEMKALSQFSVDDHQWRADYAAAQAQTWAQFATFHGEAAQALTRSGADMIASLPTNEQDALEGLIP
jgi:hypothetical protein